MHKPFNSALQDGQLNTQSNWPAAAMYLPTILSPSPITASLSWAKGSCPYQQITKRERGCGTALLLQWAAKAPPDLRDEMLGLL